jgi:TPR repeat protein
MEKKGSMLAQLSLADCYDKGLTGPRSIVHAVYYFRAAAIRGNLFAYDQLKRLYDEVKPKDFETGLLK